MMAAPTSVIKTQSSLSLAECIYKTRLTSFKLPTILRSLDPTVINTNTSFKTIWVGAHVLLLFYSDLFLSI